MIKPTCSPHALPIRLTPDPNIDIIDSTSQMSKSRENTQELRKSAMSPSAFAKDPYTDS